MTTATVQTDFSERALARAVDGNVIELWRLICANLPGAEFHDDPDAIWFASGSDVAPWLNQVLRTHFAPDNADRRVDELLASFAQRGVDAPFWCVTPLHHPDNIAALLEARGLTQASAMPGMALDLDTLSSEVVVPEGVELRCVRDADDFELWLRAYIDSFEMEEAAGRVLHGAYVLEGFAEGGPLIHYVGLVDGRPIASATVFLGNGVAGVWHIGVLASERRRGIGAAITHAPLLDARNMDHRVATLYASEMGENVYRRLSFRDCNRMVQYSRGAAS